MGVSLDYMDKELTNKRLLNKVKTVETVENFLKRKSIQKLEYFDGKTPIKMPSRLITKRAWIVRKERAEKKGYNSPFEVDFNSCLIKAKKAI